VQALDAGVPMPAPVFVRHRFAELGRDPQEWNLRMRG
jgi:hypothetical protein